MEFRQSGWADRAGQRPSGSSTIPGKPRVPLVELGFKHVPAQPNWSGFVLPPSSTQVWPALPHSAQANQKQSGQRAISRLTAACTNLNDELGTDDAKKKQAHAPALFQPLAAKLKMNDAARHRKASKADRHSAGTAVLFLTVEREQPKPLPPAPAPPKKVNKGGMWK